MYYSVLQSFSPCAGCHLLTQSTTYTSSITPFQGLRQLVCRSWELGTEPHRMRELLREVLITSHEKGHTKTDENGSTVGLLDQLLTFHFS